MAGRPPRGARSAVIDPSAAPAGPPGGANDILAAINGPAPASAAADPFAGFGGPSPQPAPSPTPTTVDFNAADPFGSALPAPTAVQGLDSLRGPVNAEAIERSFGKNTAAMPVALPDPLIQGALQDIQVKLDKLSALHTTVSELVSAVNTTGRQQAQLEKLIEEAAKASGANYLGVQAALGEVVRTLASFQHGLLKAPAAGVVGAVAPPAAPVTAVPSAPSASPADARAVAIRQAIGDVVRKKRAEAGQDFQFNWTVNPDGFFQVCQGICDRAGVPGAEKTEIQNALSAGGHMTADNLVF